MTLVTGVELQIAVAVARGHRPFGDAVFGEHGEGHDDTGPTQSPDLPVEVRHPMHGFAIDGQDDLVRIDACRRGGSAGGPPVDFRDIGADFVIYYWPALILMGLILASTVTGALVLARREDVEDGQRTD